MTINGTNISGPAEASIYHYISFSQCIKLAGSLLVCFWALLFFQTKRPRILGAQVHGSRGWWEPSFLLKTRFIYDAYNLIGSGYAKVRKLESPWAPYHALTPASL